MVKPFKVSWYEFNGTKYIAKQSFFESELKALAFKDALKGKFGVQNITIVNTVTNIKTFFSN